MDRRDFTKTIGLAAMGTVIPSGLKAHHPAKIKNKGLKMKLSFKPYELQLKHSFTVAELSRTTTPDVLVQIEYGGETGYGEASMPPYLGESIKSVSEFLSKVNLEQFNDPFQLEEIHDYLDNIAPYNRAAKASVDIALHDLIGKITKQPIYKLWGLNPEKTPYSSFTIGIDKPEVVAMKTKEAMAMSENFKILKVKLGLDNDKEMISTVRKYTQLPLCVDVNQGWKDKKQALDMIHWLKEQGVVFIEQPLAKEKIDETAWLTENSPLPIMADEAFQRLPDVIKLKGVYSGVNIKLMKSTGLYEAYKMATLAKALNMKIMIGCMTETSCAVSAAAQLSPMADWADLDGNLLIKNNPFEGMKLINGKVTLNDRPGIGIKTI